MAVTEKSDMISGVRTGEQSTPCQATRCNGGNQKQGKGPVSGYLYESIIKSFGCRGRRGFD